MKPLVTFPDPEAAAINHLRAAFGDRAETYLPTAANVSVNYPSSSLAGDATAVQVELEVGGVNDYPVTERAQVRVNCHAAKGKRSNVKNLASLTLGLLTQLQSEAVAGVAPVLGRSDVIEDPSTGNLMCWFTVRLDMRATVLS